MQRDFLGVVQKDGDGYVGACYEVGTTSYGHTVEQAFANLREATWRRVENQAAEMPSASEEELLARMA